MGASGAPRNLVERAADAAMRAAEETLGAAGASLEIVYVALHAKDVPAGELDSVSSAGGAGLPAELDERATDVVAFLAATFVSTGKAVGLDVRIVPLEHGQG